MPIIGFTCGAYDLGPHAGHIALFEEAKRQCDQLVVGLHVNPQIERPQKNRPLPSLHERFLQLSTNEYVSRVLPYETEGELVKMLKLIMPDKRFVGEEYKHINFTGKDILGIEIVYTKRHHDCSSSALRGLVCLARF